MTYGKNKKRINPRYFLHETVNRNDDGSALEEADKDFWPSGVPAPPQNPPVPPVPEVPAGYPLEELVEKYKKIWQGKFNEFGSVKRMRQNLIVDLAQTEHGYFGGRTLIKNPFFLGDDWKEVHKYVVAKVLEGEG